MFELEGGERVSVLASTRDKRRPIVVIVLFQLIITNEKGINRSDFDK